MLLRNYGNNPNSHTKLFLSVNLEKQQKTAVYLTLPLSTMSLCRSLDDRTSFLIACISSVQEAKILQGATEQRTQTLTYCNISADTELYI